MVHSDDDGLILPPYVANCHAVILPIIHDESQRVAIEDYCATLKQRLQTQSWRSPLQIEVDLRDLRGGEKRWQWIKKGACCIIEVGAKEVEQNTITYSWRDQLQKTTENTEQFSQNFTNGLHQMQQRLFKRAEAFRDSAMMRIENVESFYSFFKGNGGFALAYWSEDADVEAKLKEELKVTVRCLPQKYSEERGNCLFTGKADCPLAIFAKAY